MSIQLIQRYYAEVDRIVRFGGKANVDLDEEIRKKFNAGYTLTNILTQKSPRQNSRPIKRQAICG